jgi:hypothetical protein
MSSSSGSSSVVNASAPAEKAAPTAMADSVTPTTSGPVRVGVGVGVCVGG